MEVLRSLLGELMHHPLRADDKRLTAFMLYDQSEYLELGNGLLHPEGAEDRPAPATDSPVYAIFHVGIECRGEIAPINLEATFVTYGHLLSEEVYISLGFV